MIFKCQVWSGQAWNPAKLLSSPFRWFLLNRLNRHFLETENFRGKPKYHHTLLWTSGIFCRFDAVHLRRCLNREISDCGKVAASWRNWAKLLSDGAWLAWLKGVWRHGDIQRVSHMCFIKVEVQASFLWNSWDLHIWKISGQVLQYLELVSSWNHRCHLQENLDNNGVF